MMICFWQNTFWDKTSLLFVFRGPNSMHPEVFRHANPNGTSFKAVWWSVSDKTHFGIKHHFSLYLDGPNSMHPEVFRHANHNGTSFKAVWWSVSEQNTFWDKTSLLLCIYMAKLHAPWGFQACQSQWYKFQSCMMICFSQNTFWDKISLSFVFRWPNSMHTLRFSGMAITMVQVSKLYDDLFLTKHNFGIKHHFPLYLWEPNSMCPEVFRHANHNGTSFKAVWWSVSDKTHFGIKHHFSLYLEDQTQCTLKLSGMPITMVQVSKLYDDLFLTKHILG